MIALMKAPKSMPFGVPATGMTKPDTPGAATRNEHDEGLDNITDERRDDSRECCANDDADRHVHHASAADELFEFTDELHDPHPCSFVLAQGICAFFIRLFNSPFEHSKDVRSACRGIYFVSVVKPR